MIQQKVGFGYYVYITTNMEKTKLETGVTGDLSTRLHYLSQGFNYIPGTRTHECNFLLYWEFHEDVKEAVKRERSLNKLSFKKKKELVDPVNPGWKFLNKEVNGYVLLPQNK